MCFIQCHKKYHMYFVDWKNTITLLSKMAKIFHNQFTNSQIILEEEPLTREKGFFSLCNSMLQMMRVSNPQSQGNFHFSWFSDLTNACEHCRHVTLDCWGYFSLFPANYGTIYLTSAILPHCHVTPSLKDWGQHISDAYIVMQKLRNPWNQKYEVNLNS